MPHDHRQWTRRAFLGGMAVGGSAALVGLSSRRAAAASTLTLVDSKAEPGPGDNTVVVQRGHRTIVVSLGFNTNEAVSYRVEEDSSLTLVGRTPTGPGPRAVAIGRNGNYAVIVNSASDDMSVMSISDEGVLTEVRRIPSGGTTRST